MIVNLGKFDFPSLEGLGLRGLGIWVIWRENVSINHQVFNLINLLTLNRRSHFIGFLVRKRRGSRMEKS